MNKTINDIIDNLDMVGDRTLSTLMEKAVIEEVSPLLARIDELEGAIQVWASVIVHGQDIAGITEMDAEKALLKCIEL